MTHKRWTAKERVDIVVEYLSTNIGVAGICRKYGVSPTTFDNWRKRFMDAGKRELAGIGGNGRSDPAKALAKENESLKIVVGELTLVNTELKKSLEPNKQGFCAPGHGPEGRHELTPYEGVLEPDPSIKRTKVYRTDGEWESSAQPGLEKPRHDRKGGEKMIYIGVDVHKKMCVATVKDDDNKTVLEKDFINSRRGIEGFIKEIKDGFGKQGPITAVCEATGNYWYILHDTLEENGIDTKVAHPAKTKAIAQAKLKNDRVDSAVLADLLRADFVYEAYVPDAYYRNLRTLVRLRIDCVRSSTRCKNRVTAIMAKYDEKPPVLNKFSKKGMDWLGKVKVSDIDRIAINNCLDQLALLRKQIANLEREMARIYVKDKRIELLMTVPGIGFVIAITIIAEVVDMKRFRDAEKLVAYAGLSPSQRSSGDMRRHGHITKTGSAWLRHVMVEAARTAVRYDKRMGDIYKRIGKRQGKMKAMVGVARHMLEVSWHIVVSNEPYRTQDKGLTARKLKAMAATARPLD